MITNKLRRKKWFKSLVTILIILFTLITLPYYCTKIYDFIDPQPFKGNFFYNPYSDLSANWIKANFHAHSRTFGGIAKGENSVNELVERYNYLGYNLISISNYNQTAPKNKNQQLYITAYEHGINTNWTHQLAINSKKSTVFDFPFLQCISHKQLIINKLKHTGAMVALAHPAFKHSYRPDDLKYLTDYDFIEGLSPMATSVAEWDACLSYGHAVWLLGNDDSHGISDGNNGICWTMISADSMSEDCILQSLRQGACYATRGWLGKEMNRILSVSILDNTYELVLEKASDSIILKSNWGNTVKTVTGKNKISYHIKPSDSYLRAEIFDTEPWNNYTRMYLNPVIRTTDGTLVKHSNYYEINVLKTISFIMLLLIMHGLGIYLLYFINFKRVNTSLQPDIKKEISKIT